MKSVFLVAAIIVPLYGPAPAQSAEIVGPIYSVIDGDTFVVDGVEIRLCGVDALERTEPDYSLAVNAIRNLVIGKSVRCVPVGNGTVCDGLSPKKSYDRIVAQCFVDEIDISAYLVDNGLACDWVKYSAGYYSSKGSGTACP